ncbi:Sigma factor AlgU regulatory protein MucB [Paraburkholderia caffeinitolerans]|uniref:Sigma factor AlgU regulatory protein MucB n=1 Tax=Paraburkholderia caffeinitolerans TaxID=1723730 RepID=A0A6J5GA44_9BURK|nr:MULTISPECIES: MucB/RseB C-terminal domain-containing protein [Paraburkholderia]CAB3794905.1 Sigma factor AlgU regulatory protein MucB [Paraburkholderia caffeinitolerans]
MQIERFNKTTILGRLPALLCCAAVMFTALSAATHAHAQGASAASAVDPAARQSALQWLDRIQQAAQQLNYAGTFVYQRGAFVQSSRITHYATKSDGEYEQLESLDGKPRKMLRHNDDLYTFVPERKLCVVEKRQNKEAFPALLATNGEQVLAVYEPKMLGSDRVAGIDSSVIELSPKDAYRFAYKLWVDAKTGLLLRAQTLDPSNGQVLQQLSFTQVSIGVPVDKAPIVAGMRNTAGWTVVRAPLQTVDMGAQGWTFAQTVPGFRMIREVRRPMAARDANEPPIPVDQAVFSDGLSAVSVFVEPVEHNSRKEGSGSSGATHVLVKRSGDYWITLLGEVPQATLQQFASAIEYKAPK